MTKIVIADDHPLVRQGLRAVFAGAPDIDVVAEVANGQDAVNEVLRRHPDVVLMDLDMPELHGIEATRQIAAESPATAVIVLTMFEDDESVFAAINAGAKGYLLKGSDGTDILTAVRAAATGQTVFGPAFADRLRTWFSHPSSHRESPFPDLTPRELEVLDRIAAGLSNAEIGEQLHLSTKTIANNVSTIFNKLEVTRRGQAIVRARDAGLGKPDSEGSDSNIT